MDFSVLGEISDVETFAVGRRIRELRRLRKQYGHGRWRNRNGVGRVRLADGTIRRAELRYEPTGVAAIVASSFEALAAPLAAERQCVMRTRAIAELK